MRTDSAEYLRRIRLLLEGEWFFDTIELGHPLYTAWCALVHRVIGGGDLSFRAIVHSSQVAGVLAWASSVVPCYWAARSLLRDRTAAVGAACLYCAMPLSVWWAGELMTDAVALATVVWAMGLFATWTRSGSTVALVAGFACLGGAMLVRVSTVLLLPAIAWFLVCGMIARRSWRPVVWSPVAALVVVATVVAHWLVADVDRSIADYFARSRWNRTLDFTLLGEGARPAVAFAQARHGFTDVALVCAAFGLVVASVTHRVLAGLALLWLVPVIGIPLLNRMTPFQVRFLLPIAAIVPMLVSVPLAARAARGPMRWLGVAAVAIVAAACAIRIPPDLWVLRDRAHVGYAVASWYSHHAPAGSLVFAGEDLVDAQVIADDCDVYLATRYQYDPWPEPRARSAPRVAWMADRALRRGRAVFFADTIDFVVRRGLTETFEVERVHTIAASSIRNLSDPIMTEMGPRMAESRAVAIYRITRRKRTALLPLPAPIVRRDGPKKTIVVSAPWARGHRVVVVHAAEPHELDWLRRRMFMRSAFGPARRAATIARARPLSPAGRATFDIPAERTGVAAYGMIDATGKLIGISVATRY